METATTEKYNFTIQEIRPCFDFTPGMKEAGIVVLQIKYEQEDKGPYYFHTSLRHFVEDNYRFYNNGLHGLSEELKDKWKQLPPGADTEAHFYRACEREGVDFAPLLMFLMRQSNLAFYRWMHSYSSENKIPGLDHNAYLFRPDGFLHIPESPPLANYVLGKRYFHHLVAHYLFQETQQLLYQFFPHLYEADEALQRQVAQTVKGLALKLSKKTESFAIMQDDYEYDKWAIDHDYPSPTRKKLLRDINAARKKNKAKSNPIFCLTILEVHWCWETTGVNEMRVELLIRHKGGMLRREILFSHLIDEACRINYPLYKYIRKIYDTTEAIHPKEKEIFEALMEGGVPLEPLAISYMADYNDIMSYCQDYVVETLGDVPEDAPELVVQILDVDDYANCPHKDVALMQQATLLEEALFKMVNPLLRCWFPDLFYYGSRGLLHNHSLWARHFCQSITCDNWTALGFDKGEEEPIPGAGV